MARYPGYLRTKTWASKRLAALKRAGYRCQQCGATERLQVHHVTYARLGRELAADLQVLCRTCHRKAHGLPVARRKRKARTRV